MGELRRPSKRDVDLYLSCMEQIKFRVNGIGRALSEMLCPELAQLDGLTIRGSALYRSLPFTVNFAARPNHAFSFDPGG